MRGVLEEWGADISYCGVCRDRKTKTGAAHPDGAGGGTRPGRVLMGGSSPIDSYTALIGLLEEHEARLLRTHGMHICCRKGCSSCCILHTVNAIEALAVVNAVIALPRRKRESLRRRLLSGRIRSTACILLSRGSCVIYGARPVICRTHGYPVLADGNVDACPLNFRGLEELEPSCVLDLERLNTALAAMNIRFQRGSDDDFFRRDRIPLRDAVERALALADREPPVPGTKKQ